MEELYLNYSNRQFYSDALTHIRDCDNENWDLDEGLGSFIDTINSNSRIRTMSSKRGRLLGYGQHSYLVICYAKEIELKLRKNVHDALTLSFDKSLFKPIISYENPLFIKESKETKPLPFLKYIDDPNYWNVHRIRYELKGGGIEIMTYSGTG